MEDYYAVLGVSPDADASQIRRAYIGRTKVLHPDRFDRKAHPDEWQLANEMTAALNRAYAVLKDPLQRRAYDASRADGPKTPKEQHADPSKYASSAPPSAVDVSSIGPGKAKWADLPAPVQRRLKERQEAPALDQFRRCEQSLSAIYCLAAIPLLFIGGVTAIVLSTSVGFRNVAESWAAAAAVLLGLGGGCLVILSEAIAMLFEWRSCVLRPHFYVTPLYIIRTGFNTVAFWPIWAISDISATLRRVNGLDYGGNVVLTLGQDRIRFSVSSAYEYKTFQQTLRTNGRKLQAAVTRGDTAYIHSNDDFAGAMASTSRVSDSRWRYRGKAYALGTGLSMLAVLIGGVCTPSMWQRRWYEHRSAPEVSQSTVDEGPRRSDPVSAVAPAQPTRPVQTENNRPLDRQPTRAHPIQSLPLTGSGRYYASAERVAPLEISTSGSEHHLVKLVHKASGRTVMDVFVRAGESTKVEVPLGTYEVRYASGREWYGYVYLFGPETGYCRADETFTFRRTYGGYSGFSITLYAVRNGNLETTPISAEEF